MAKPTPSDEEVRLEPVKGTRETVNVSLPRGVATWLREYAHKNGVTVSSVVAVAIAGYRESLR